mmetsp:Transcript_55083/g.112616  ORF Transcript_55083/g.112616 Transcript_55083/m.112616 type:complete len:381 (+) Transcript_55083:153-1295(+)
MGRNRMVRACLHAEPKGGVHLLIHDGTPVASNVFISREEVLLLSNDRARADYSQPSNSVSGGPAVRTHQPNCDQGSRPAEPGQAVYCNHAIGILDNFQKLVHNFQRRGYSVFEVKIMMGETLVQEQTLVVRGIVQAHNRFNVEGVKDRGVCRGTGLARTPASNKFWTHNVHGMFSQPVILVRVKRFQGPEFVLCCPLQRIQAIQNSQIEGRVTGRYVTKRRGSTFIDERKPPSCHFGSPPFFQDQVRAEKECGVDHVGNTRVAVVNQVTARNSWIIQTLAYFSTKLCNRKQVYWAEVCAESLVTLMPSSREVVEERIVLDTLVSMLHISVNGKRESERQDTVHPLGVFLDRWACLRRARRLATSFPVLRHKHAVLRNFAD